MYKYKAVLFDFDGTIADTGEGIFECVAHAVEQEKLPPLTHEQLKTFIGPPIIESYLRYYPEIGTDGAHKMLNIFREKYSKEGVYKFIIYDGVEKLINNIRNAGIKVGIASSKPETFIKNIIQVSKIDHLFDFCIGAAPEFNDPDKSMIVKDALERMGVEKDEILMVGDRKFDIIGAHKNDIPCAAVLYGYGNREEFEEFNAEFIVSDCDELEKLILAE